MTLAGFTLDQFEAACKSRLINGTLPPSLAFPPQLVESEPLHPGFRTSYEPEANPQLVVSIGLHPPRNQRQSRQRLRRRCPPAGIVYRRVSLAGLHSTGATTFCGYAQTPPSRFRRQQESAIFLSRGKRSTPRAGRELRSRGVRLRTSRRNSPPAMLLHGGNGAGVPVVQSGQMAGSGCFVPTCWAGTNRKGWVALTGMRLRCR